MEKGKTAPSSKEVDLTLQLSQKDTVGKALKKEVGQLKTVNQKLKLKNTSLKEQIEAVNQKPTQPVDHHKKKQPVVKMEQPVSPFETTLIEKLT